MKCDMCDSDATVFLTQIIDGKMTQVNLCDKCSKDKGVTDPTGFQLADFLLGAAQKKPKQVSHQQDDEGLACPSCGFTRAHLKKIGRMGCPDCYRVFADDLESMLRAMHKGTRHIGKAPVKQAVAPPEPSAPAKTTPSSEVRTLVAPPVPPPASPANLKRKLADLKSAIDKAVADERYEDAAKLRDQMRDIESKIA
ncbi:excinuclease ABC subunit B [Phragmitibacter flavus]|uniref:Excinuclease ABC subunit B n=1 Tax=Phragmitibacter flavus TaxID=2576071 RepID=A0A5R8KJ66_9BACT|nr:UvrB/UvrC motif-containing protein [Phragmitibacter flavus]TLD71985.1 excinuclease ABC subunit B [Phragmitibacter flavus]